MSAGQPAVKVTDLFSFTRTTAYRIIVRAIFTDDFGEAETAKFQEILDRLQAYIIHPIRLPFLRKPLKWLGIEEYYLGLAQTSREMLLKHIRTRRDATEVEYEDLLQMLLDSRYEDTGLPMTDERLVDEVLILFAAGYETSANALAWTIWLLLGHPGELEKVKVEVSELHGPATYGTVDQLSYLTQVIRESMRLYPPAWITDRVATTDDAAGGYAIRAGTTVGIFIYGIHRSEKLYADPDRFLPSRMRDGPLQATSSVRLFALRGRASPLHRAPFRPAGDATVPRSSSC